MGAAIACPERKVVCLEGDGSAMYTIQALWTMARENLDVTVVIFNNRKYSILELEFGRTGARGGKPGPKAASMLNIGGPDMDFVAIARGMGVQAARATTAEEFNTLFAAAMAAKGPRLIDALVPTLFGEGTAGRRRRMRRVPVTGTVWRQRTSCQAEPGDMPVRFMAVPVTSTRRILRLPNCLALISIIQSGETSQSSTVEWPPFATGVAIIPMPH